ncbi:unnamed protein product [Ceratitis capitata]|uniref:(Mediterranean fruit fly) hypothetical protein n=1 Tax=Ceratitis capitata TaxID=7213 RepID=A0A811VER7_CERCA|nr:unnamed protein product [Ceratitis capitata]
MSKDKKSVLSLSYHFAAAIVVATRCHWPIHDISYNYLLRRIKDNVKDYRDINNSTIQNLEHQKIETNSKLRAVDINLTAKHWIIELAILIEWLQDLARKEHKNLQTLKYLYNNREHFRPAVKVLRDYALKLVIFGVEMDDLFRIFSRETMMFLRTSANNTALKELNGLRRRE